MLVVKYIKFPSFEEFMDKAITTATGYEVKVGAYNVGIKVVAASTIDRSFTIAGAITEEGVNLFPVSIAAKEIVYVEQLFTSEWQAQDVKKWYDETVAMLNERFTNYMNSTYLEYAEDKSDKAAE